MRRAVVLFGEDGKPVLYSPDAELSITRLNHSADGEVLDYDITVTDQS